MWRFGTDLPQFATFQEAMSSEMTLFFAPDPIAGWNDSIELTVFTLSLLFAMVLLVLNFMLGNQLGWLNMCMAVTQCTCTDVYYHGADLGRH